MNLLGTLRARSGVDSPTARRALALALAAWLSFAVAASLHVHNAYWAAMPVWVIAQASRGLVLERAAFRIVGTLIGAAAGFALVHTPIAPLLQLLVLALWIAVNAGLTHVLRGVTGYAALLAGMTAAIVVIPSVLTPTESTAIAAARVECTLIGVIVSTLVLAWLTPESPLTTFYSQLRAVAADAVEYAGRLLGGTADDVAERRIVGRISELEATARLTSAGSLEGYRRIGDVDALVVGALAAMAAAQASRAGGGGGDAALLAELERLAAQLRGTGEPSANAPTPGSNPHGTGAPGRLHAAMRQIRAADTALRRPPATLAAARPAWLAAHREWPLAWRSGVLAGVVGFVAAALGLWGQWPALQLAAIGACIFVLVLGAMPLPQLVAPKLLAGVAVGVVAALFYRLAVQPSIATTTGLLLTLAPFLLLGGWARACPRTSAAALDANMCFLLASQVGMPATTDLAGLLADAAALTLSAATVAGAFIVLPRRAERQAADAAAAIRGDLLRIIASPADRGARDWQARGARQILRLTLHLSRANDLAERWPAGLLAALNLGQAILALQQLGMPDTVRALLVDMLRQKMPPPAAVQALRAIADGADAADGGEPHKALAELIAALAGAADLLSYGRPASRGR